MFFNSVSSYIQTFVYLFQMFKYFSIGNRKKDPYNDFIITFLKGNETTYYKLKNLVLRFHCLIFSEFS